MIKIKGRGADSDGVRWAARTPLRPLRHHRRGFALAEVVVGLTVLVLTIVTTTHAMIINHRWAALARLRTAARAVVQRNIDTALSVNFTTTTTPGILATTVPAGVVWDDDGGGDNLVTLTTAENGETSTAHGTLTRIVTAVSNPEDATVRRITFRLSYTLASRTYTTEMSTIRSLDD